MLSKRKKKKEEKKDLLTIAGSKKEKKREKKKKTEHDQHANSIESGCSLEVSVDRSGRFSRARCREAQHSVIGQRGRFGWTARVSRSLFF